MFLSLVLAVISCNPTVHPLYRKPAGTATTRVLKPREVPGATSPADDCKRIGAGSAAAMLGIREAYLQRVLWPRLNGNGGGGKSFTGDPIDADFAPASATVAAYDGAPERKGMTPVNSAWIGGYDGLPFADDLNYATNRIYTSPRISKSVRDAAAEIITRFASCEQVDSMTWLVPNVDHLGLVNDCWQTNSDVNVADFSKGAFLALARADNDLSTNGTPKCAFYGPAIVPADLHGGASFAYISDQIADDWCEKYSPNGSDTRDAGDISAYLKAAAPGLPDTVEEMRRVVEISESPRLLWQPLMLANGILALESDLLICSAHGNLWSHSPDMDQKANDIGNHWLKRLGRFARGMTSAPCGSSRTEFVYSYECTTDDDPNLSIADTQNIVDYYPISVAFNPKAFSRDSSTNETVYAEGSTAVFTNSVTDTEYYWRQTSPACTVKVRVEQGLSKEAVDDGYNDAVASRLTDLGVPPGTYEDDDFEVRTATEFDVEGKNREAIYIVWAHDVVPEATGKLVKKLVVWPTSHTKATLVATQSHEFDSQLFAGYPAPYFDAYSPEHVQDGVNVNDCNVRPVALSATALDVSSYVDIHTLGYLFAVASTNESVNGIYLQTTNVEQLATGKCSSRLMPRRVDGSAGSFIDATQADVRAAWEQAKALSTELLGWGSDDDRLYPITATNLMVETESGLEYRAFNVVTNSIMVLEPNTSFGHPQGLRLTVAEDRSVKFECVSNTWATLTYSFASVTNTPPKRSPTVMFSVGENLYMKWRFPMLDTDGTSWPSIPLNN